MSHEWHITRANAPAAGQLAPAASAAPGESRRRPRGSTLVEFAVVCPMLLLIVLGIMDFGRLFFTQLTLQHALREAGRFAVTGNKLPNPSNPSQNLPRVDSIKAVAQQSAAGLDLTNIKITSKKGGTNHAGAPTDTVTISLTTHVKLLTPIVAKFFPDGAHKITASTTFKNEPFHPGNTV
jgi:Flp pilus assembly protein TadG